MEKQTDHHLVFMPGLDGTGKSFEPLLPFLAADDRITIVRYPADRILSFEQTVSCAAAQMPKDISPVIIAESFSGPVAVRMIASNQVAARALVLCATFARSPHPFLWRIVRGLGLPLLIRPDMPKIFFRFVIGEDRWIDDLMPLWKKVHEDVTPRVMAHRLSLINEVDVTADLDSLTLPCLYLQATRDRIVPASCLKDYQRAIRHLQVVSMAAPHFILQAKPQACLDAIFSFLRRQAA
ncbi:MAG: alpha/beta hydrolase [Smithellaceae bacterium]